MNRLRQLLCTAIVLSPTVEFAAQPADPPLPDAVQSPPAASVVESPAPAFEAPGPAEPTWHDLYRGWLFRRYAGPVEMRERVYYPPGYYGNYYFRGWKPDWVAPQPVLTPNYHCAPCEDATFAARQTKKRVTTARLPNK